VPNGAIRQQPRPYEAEGYVTHPCNEAHASDFLGVRSPESSLPSGPTGPQRKNQTKTGHLAITRVEHSQHLIVTRIGGRTRPGNAD